MKRNCIIGLFALLPFAASADLLGVSVGASAGASRISYDGNSDYGYEYGINATYHINDIFSVNAGFVQGSAEVDSQLASAKNDIDYTSFPITLRGDLPFVIGSLYAKAGTNYYNADRELAGKKNTEKGWGFTGGAGVVLSFIPVVDLTLGYEYRDMGGISNNAFILSVGVGI